ncbi:MAG: hypothetical protein KAI88_02835 [Nitrosomonadaceae bacterium]|nr:hypothetical protein [Nitrosomonadaceae bacterium]
MNELTLARIIHLLGVVLWIGGVAMITTVLLPVTAKMHSVAEKIEFFEYIENRFAAQARFTTLITGLSGFYMVYILDAWSRFTELRYWWMHAMVIVWLLFMLLLYVLEPLVLHRRVKNQAQHNPIKILAMIQRIHWVLLSLSLITVIGAVAGSHGWMLSVG